MERRIQASPIHEQLRNRRIALGMSQHALARDSGVPRTSIRRIESGDSDPRFDRLEKIAGALNTDVCIVFYPNRLRKYPVIVPARVILPL